MWRRLYLLLVLVRLYFALSPSYMHPDEHFQGPEVMAGVVFDWPTTRTWEFTSAAPIRSFFPLWVVYGMPMQMVQWMVAGDEAGPRASLVFVTLRVLFFVASFVLEDWALQELVSPRRRTESLLLLASSYVTWTYQTHTFTNAVETVQVLWALVLVERVARAGARSAWVASALLGATAALGVFTRVTFPAFVLLPALRLLPHFVRRPASLVVLLLVAAATAATAVYFDTLFYGTGPARSVFSLWRARPVVTPLNNLLYNADPRNLATHGLHPRYTHLLVNLPQLLGPALLCILSAIPSARTIDFGGAGVLPTVSLPLLSVLSGVAVLSVFQHQEARFLIPAVPLLLTCARLPSSPALKRLWIGTWLLFNVTYGVLMGTYHQAGIVPAQLFLGAETNATNIIYWKTYPPPTWLLGARSAQAQTTDLMGESHKQLLPVISAAAACPKDEAREGVLEEPYLVAPLSATVLDRYVDKVNWPFYLEKVWETRRHVGLDDLDIPEKGLWSELKRVWGRRGLAVWRIRRRACNSKTGKRKDMEPPEKAKAKAAAGLFSMFD